MQVVQQTFIRVYFLLMHGKVRIGLILFYFSQCAVVSVKVSYIYIYIAHASLELYVSADSPVNVILLYLKCWDYRYVPPCPVSMCSSGPDD